MSWGHFPGKTSKLSWLCTQKCCVCQLTPTQKCWARAGGTDSMVFGGTSCPHISYPLVEATAVDLQLLILGGKSCPLGLDTVIAPAIWSNWCPKGDGSHQVSRALIASPLPHVQWWGMLQGETRQSREIGHIPWDRASRTALQQHGFLLSTCCCQRLNLLEEVHLSDQEA